MDFKDAAWIVAPLPDPAPWGVRMAPTVARLRSLSPEDLEAALKAREGPATFTEDHQAEWLPPASYLPPR